jgi:hypothetical protein
MITTTIITSKTKEKANMASAVTRKRKKEIEAEGVKKKDDEESDEDGDDVNEKRVNVLRVSYPRQRENDAEDYKVFMFSHYMTHLFYSSTNTNNYILWYNAYFFCIFLLEYKKKKRFIFKAYQRGREGQKQGGK